MADLPDAATLTDEELDKVLNGEDLEDTDESSDKPDNADTDDKTDDKSDDDSAKEDVDTDSNADDTANEDEDDVTDTKKEASKKPSHREQARIQDLLKKYGNPDKPKQPEITGSLDLETELEADDETIKRLKDDREKVSRESFNQGLEQAKSLQFLTRLEIDAPRVEAKYPQLDKTSDEFKADAANDVNTLYLALSGYDPKTQQVANPNIRYATFVDTIFRLSNDLADQKVEDVTKNIKKQAGKTGLRPDGSRAKKLDLNKDPHDMTDEELDAVIATNLKF